MLPRYQTGNVYGYSREKVSILKRIDLYYRWLVVSKCPRDLASFLISLPGRIVLFAVTAIVSLAVMSMMYDAVFYKASSPFAAYEVFADESLLHTRLEKQQKLDKAKDADQKEAKKLANEAAIKAQQKAYLKENEEKLARERKKAEMSKVSEQIVDQLFIKIAEEDKKLEQDDNIMQGRRNAVRNAFIHAWNGYKKYAFGHDEIRPVTNRTNDSWGGFGITILDSLDTMLLMGLKRQYAESREFLKDLNFRKNYDCSFFETTIRILGGLLGAFELSKDPFWLEKADQLGEQLFPAFSAPNNIPYSIVNMLNGNGRFPSWTSGSAILSEVGSIQLEFKYLGYHTGKQKYYTAVDRIIDSMQQFAGLDSVPSGLFPVYINGQTRTFTSDSASVGALSDSFYEYLLKQWILTGGFHKDAKNNEDLRYRHLYEKAVHAIKDNLFMKHKGYAFVSEAKGGKANGVADHLVCFVPGMLALGAFGQSADMHMDMAKTLMESCAQLYFDQKTGLAPESIQFMTSYNYPDLPAYEIKSKTYLLRPETVESLFYMWRRTKDPKYREWGWQIFLSLEKYCKTPSAFSGVTDVNEIEEDKAPWNDSMQSFFLAETLKYFWLLFSPDSSFDLNALVLTTEAHPLGILDSEKRPW